MEGISAGIGRSADQNSFVAGAEAAAEAEKNISGKPGILMIFSDSTYRHEELIAGIESVFKGIPMVGGTTAGELCTYGFSTGSVVIMAICSDEIEFTTGISVNMREDECRCGSELVKDITSRHSLDDALSLIIFPCGMGGDGEQVIAGIYSALEKPLEVVGGLLGDGEMFENTFQYYNGTVYKNAIAGLLISSKAKYGTGVGVRSGFASIGNRMFCTEADGNVIKKIDGVRALDLYMELLGEKRSERLPEVCLEYPFGLIDQTVLISGKEYFQLRCGLNVDRSNGTITCAGSIPEGSAITITTGSRGDLINGAEDAAEQARDSLCGATPELIFVFSCVGRKLVLGRRVEEEIETVKRVLGPDIPLIGFYTYGEIGPADKAQDLQAEVKFHNETLIVWVLGS